jgi:hypothetical protein
MKIAALFAAATLASVVSTAVLADEANPTCAEFAAMSPEAQTAAIDMLKAKASEGGMTLSFPEGGTYEQDLAAVTAVCEGQAGETVLIDALKKM